MTLRYVFRRMLRSPGFSGMVIVTIALGVGVNLGVFTIIQALFLNLLGVPDADRVVYYTLGTGRDTKVRLDIQQYTTLRTHAAANDILAWRPMMLKLQGPAENTFLNGALVTGNTFSVLGVKPFSGRFFSEADDVEGGGKNGWTAVLGYSYWVAHWAADPNVVGKTVNLNGASVQIVGVLPPEFTGVEPFKKLDIVVPRQFETVTDGVRLSSSSGAVYLNWFVLGRLPTGISIQQVQANLKTIEPSFISATLPSGLAKGMFPSTAPGSLLGVQDGRMGVTPFRAVRDPLFLLQGLGGAVLLFCCCNLILLFIGRARREAHATAIRLALGARPGDQARMAAVEAVVLGGLACLVAIPLAWGTSRLLSVVIRSARGLDKFPMVGADYFLLLVTVGIALAAGCLAAAGTSLWIGAKRASVSLRETNHTMAPRSRNWIIGVEVAVSITLVTATIVSVVGFQTISSQSGFDGQAVTAKFTGGFFNPELDGLLSRIRGSPGVQAVATASELPLSGSRAMRTVKADSSGGGIRELHAWTVNVNLDYFSAIGTRIVRGRDFQPGDLGHQACILSANAASALFPEEEPVGKSLSDPVCHVIGIAEDAHFLSMAERADAVLYKLVRQPLPPIIVKAATSTLAMQAVANAGQDKFRSIEPMQVSIDRDLRLWKLVTTSGTFCALLAGIILAVGFFGILSLQVAERRREVGVRIALGGSAARVSFALLRKVGPAVMVGLACGAAGAWPAAAMLAEMYHLKFQVMVACYLGSVVLLGLLMLAAVAAPLGRALAISPVECLAAE